MKIQTPSALDGIRHRAIALVLVIAAVLVCAGFAWKPSNDSQAAIDYFWQVYHGNDYSAIPLVEAQLQQALERDPGNPALHALLGAAHFWHIGEGARDPNPNDQCLVNDIDTKLSGDGYTILDMLADVTQADSFRLRVQATP